MPDDIANAQRLRRTLGFRSDAAYVTELARTHAATTALGIPMTEEEQAEVDRRLELQNRLEDVRAELADDPAVSTLWLDQKGGGVVVVDVLNASRGPAAVATVERITGGRARYRVVDVSERDLDELHQQIADAADTLAHEGVDIVSIGTDTVRNRVVVGVSELTDDAVRRIRRAAGDGPIDVIEAEAGTDD